MDELKLSPIEELVVKQASPGLIVVVASRFDALFVGSGDAQSPKSSNSIIRGRDD